MTESRPLPAAAQEEETARLRAEIASLRAENRRRALVMRIGQELGRQIELETLLPLVIAKVTEVMEADRSSLFLYDRAAGELWTLVGEGLDSAQIRIPVTAGIAGHVARTGNPLNVADAYACEHFDRSWDQKTGYRTKSVLCMPLLDKKQGVLGVLQVLNKRSGGSFTEEDAEFLGLLSGQIAITVETAALYRRIETLFESFVDAISIAIDSRDPVTAGHSRRVTEYALRIARAMHHDRNGPFREVSFTRAQYQEIRYAGLLHDFGKVGVPEEILQKAQRLPKNWIQIIEERLGRLRAESLLSTDGPEPAEDPAVSLDGARDFLARLNTSGFLSDEELVRLDAIRAEGWINETEYHYLSVRRGTLTPEERTVIESHVAKMLSVLGAIPWPEEIGRVPEIAGSHHEFLDGSGYPRGLDHDAVPLGGRILAVADIYDALTAQDRPYKPAIPHEKSAAILRDMTEMGKLDPAVVKLFLGQQLYADPPAA